MYFKAGTTRLSKAYVNLTPKITRTQIREVEAIIQLLTIPSVGNFSESGQFIIQICLQIYTNITIDQ